MQDINNGKTEVRCGEGSSRKLSGFCRDGYECLSILGSIRALKKNFTQLR